MKYLTRYILSKTVKPFLQHYYLKSARTWCYDSMELRVFTGVFHPGLFQSSKFLADHLKTYEMNGMRALDVGCGSGLLSLVAANAGANVTSIDNNPEAILNTLENASTNNLRLTALESDLFDKVEGTFSFIFINPPYYPKNPQESSGQAWYCGEDYSYFDKFFTQLPSYITQETTILMVLSETCDLEKIQDIAQKYNFEMLGEMSKNTLIERFDIFKITTLIL